MSEGEISNPYLSEEIVMEILSRLPINSLLQCRSVSKQWRSIIEDAHFIRLHLLQSLVSPGQYRLLLPTSPLQSVDYNASSDMAVSPMELNCPFLSQISVIKIVGSFNGLVCVLLDYRDLILFNPSTRHSKALLAPQLRDCFSLGINLVYGFGCGLDPLDFKIVVLSCFARHTDSCPDVLWGQNDGIWRTKYLTRNFDFVGEVGTFLNGAFHWFATRSGSEARFIASLDVSQETFKEICLPPHIENFPYYNLGSLKDNLYVLCDNPSYNHVDFWVMKEYGVETSWMTFIRMPRDMGTQYISYMVPLSFTKDGEVLLEVDSRDFVAYDTKKNTFRNVMVRDGPSWSGDAVVYVECLVSPDGVE